MYATYDGIGDFEQDFQTVISPMDGEVEDGALLRRSEDCTLDGCRLSGTTPPPADSGYVPHRPVLFLGLVHKQWSKKSHSNEWRKGSLFKIRRHFWLAGQNIV